MAGASCAITCPANVFNFTGPSSINCKAPVSYPAPSTSGSCGTVTCTPPSGSIFDVGTTTVNCAEGSGAKCSFTVTLADNTPPKLTCSNGVTVTAPSGKTSTPVDYPAPTGTDNCSSVDIKCSPPSGSTFNIGNTLVTCTGTDSSVNTAQCFFTVTVRDADGPVIVCPASVNVSPRCRAIIGCRYLSASERHRQLARSYDCMFAAVGIDLPAWHDSGDVHGDGFQRQSGELHLLG